MCKGKGKSMAVVVGGEESRGHALDGILSFMVKVMTGETSKGFMNWRKSLLVCVYVCVPACVCVCSCIYVNLQLGAIKLL